MKAFGRPCLYSGKTLTRRSTRIYQVKIAFSPFSVSDVSSGKVGLRRDRPIRDQFDGAIDKPAVLKRGRRFSFYSQNHSLLQSSHALAPGGGAFPNGRASVDDTVRREWLGPISLTIGF